MYKSNRISFILLMVSTFFYSCISSRIPFNFERDINPTLLKQVIQNQKISEDNDVDGDPPSESLPLAPTGTAQVYQTEFVEGWLEQDNFIDLAILNKDREKEFVSYDAGTKHHYNSYIIIFNLTGSNRKPFLLFTVQSLAGNKNIVSGFSKVYYGDLAQNTHAYLLSAQRILLLKKTKTAYSIKEFRKTHIRFLLDHKPTLVNNDSIAITKIAFSDQNELSGSKTLEIPVDKVMGKPGSLTFRNYSRKIIMKKEVREMIPEIIIK